MLGCWPHLGARNARQKIKLNELYPNLLSSNNFRRIHIESSVLVKGVYRFFPRGPATPAGPRMKSCSPLSIMKSDLVLPHESLRMVVLQLYRVAVLVHRQKNAIHPSKVGIRGIMEGHSSDLPAAVLVRIGPPAHS